MGLQRVAVWCKASPEGAEGRPGAAFLNHSRERRVLPLQRFLSAPSGEARWYHGLLSIALSSFCLGRFFVPRKRGKVWNSRLRR